MFKKLTIYFLLINFLNTLVFQSVDNHHANDVVIDEINTIFEYITEVLLDQQDTTPEDEDDDIADAAKTPILDDYTIVLTFSFLASEKTIAKNIHSFYQISAYNCLLEGNFPPPKVS